MTNKDLTLENQTKPSENKYNTIRTIKILTKYEGDIEDIIIKIAEDIKNKRLKENKNMYEPKNFTNAKLIQAIEDIQKLEIINSANYEEIVYAVSLAQLNNMKTMSMFGEEKIAKVNADDPMSVQNEVADLLNDFIIKHKGE